MIRGALVAMAEVVHVLVAAAVAVVDLLALVGVTEIGLLHMTVLAGEGQLVLMMIVTEECFLETEQRYLCISVMHQYSLKQNRDICISVMHQYLHLPGRSLNLVSYSAVKFLLLVSEDSGQYVSY